jgi:hypothetical protein
MSKFTNPVNISSGRRLHVGQPMDDRVVYQSASDIEADIIAGRTTTWYEGLVTEIHDLHALYVWRWADEANPNVDYNAALLLNNFVYPNLPNDDRANKAFNWYPFREASTYYNDEPVSATNLEGFPEGSIPGGPHSMQEMWDTLLYPYVAPLISLNGSPSPGYYEKGNVITAVNLAATTVKKKLNIEEVEFFKDNSSIYLQATPNAAGGTEYYLHEDDIGTGVNPPDVTFMSNVKDGTSTVNSNVISYMFVYPVYVGSLTQTTPNESQVKSLTKLVIPKQNVTHEFNFVQQRYVFAYPQSYGPLVSILDTNLFETLDDYDVQSATYTMLDGASVDYYIYVFNPYNAGLLTDAVNFKNTFRF